MIENPVEWFNKSGKYGLPTKYPVQFGSVFIIDEKAPDEVKKDYIKYINIAKKIFFSSGIGIFKPRFDDGLTGYRLVGFKDNLEGVEKEQSDIIKKLIDDGCISNEPFI